MPITDPAFSAVPVPAALLGGGGGLGLMADIAAFEEPKFSVWCEDEGGG